MNVPEQAFGEGADALPLDGSEEVAELGESPGHGAWEYVGVLPMVGGPRTAPDDEGEANGSEDEPRLILGKYSALFRDAHGSTWGRRGPATDVPQLSPEDSAGIPGDYDPSTIDLDALTPEWIIQHAPQLLAAAGRSRSFAILPGREGVPQGVLMGELPDDGVRTRAPVGGTDNRHVVNSSATLTSYPWRNIGNILYADDYYQNGHCTGTMVGPRHVITAGHCLYDSSTNTWSNADYFAPGQQVTSFNNGVYVITGVYAAGDGPIGWDYGLLRIADSSSFASLGWWGSAWWSPSSHYVGKWTYLSGYPEHDRICVDSPRIDDLCGSYMYRHASSVPDEPHTDLALYYYNDATGGQSGSALMHIDSNGTPLVLGIHRGGNSTRNHASRMRSVMWNDLCSFINDWPSAYADHPCE